MSAIMHIYRFHSALKVCTFFIPFLLFYMYNMLPRLRTPVIMHIYAYMHIMHIHLLLFSCGRVRTGFSCTNTLPTFHFILLSSWKYALFHLLLFFCTIDGRGMSLKRKAECDFRIIKIIPLQQQWTDRYMLNNEGTIRFNQLKVPKTLRRKVKMYVKQCIHHDDNTMN